MATWDNRFPEAVHFSSEQAKYPTHDPEMSNSGHCTVRDGHAGDLLRRRMMALGLDPDKVALSDPALLLHLRKCCALCKNPEDCSLDLARASTGQPWQGRDDWRDYCENVLALEMLVALRSRSHVPEGAAE
jgi:hypothetical protein